MSKLDKTSRLLIPKDLIDMSSLKVSSLAYLVYDSDLSEFFLSNSPVDNLFALASLKLDEKGRITLSSSIKETLEIDKNSNIITAYRNDRIYLLRKNIF